MFTAILFFVIGLGILILGAEGLVRGASSLALRWGIPPLVVGLTIVAFGTSAPELVVNMFAAVNGTADIAIGNIVGSNIVNLLLILGLSAFISPLIVQKTTVWKEIPFALLGAVLILLMGNDAFFDVTQFNGLSKSDGFALIGFFIVFLYYIYGIAKQEKEISDDESKYTVSRSIVYVIAGLVGLFFGGKLLVDNAVILARLAGLSETFIGLTIVAVGTSMPEFATSIVAAIRKQNDIAIGNIVGSNIFNVFWILGLTSTILSLPFDPIVNIDLFVNIGATFALFALMFIGKKYVFERWQGGLFVLGYIAYVIFLIYRG